MKLTHAYEEMAPEKRPQDQHPDGIGLRFKTLDHGCEYPDTMPAILQSIVTSAELIALVSAGNNRRNPPSICAHRKRPSNDPAPAAG